MIWDLRFARTSTGNSGGFLEIGCPDRSTKTHAGVVGTLDNLILIRPAQDWKNWAERLLLDQSGVFFGVVNDGGRNEVACRILDLAANSNLHAIPLDIVEEALDTIVLHRVLDGTKENTFLVTLANFEKFCVLDQSIPELIDDLLMY